MTPQEKNEVKNIHILIKTDVPRQLNKKLFKRTFLRDLTLTFSRMV